MSEKHEQPTYGRDDVARLVRLAGKRSAVPPERAERVRTAARATWQREVESRSRKRNVWMVAALATAALLLLAIGLTFLPFGGRRPTASRTLTVASQIGEVWILERGSDGEATRRKLAVGHEVTDGAEVQTADAGSVALLYDSGHSVRLDRGTRLRVREDGALALDGGAVYVDAGTGAGGATPLDVYTPFGRVEEIGTQFELRLAADSLRVRLREGAVVLHHGEQPLEVRAGSELEMSADGSVVRRTILPYGAEWDWIAGITPTPDFEGRSARAFLDWVARERGWKLAFADAETSRAADATVLRGTLQRLTLDEALDAVLPTCRMTHHLTAGTLVVSPE